MTQEVKSPITQHHFSDNDAAVLVTIGKTKPKQVFWSIQNAFKKLLRNFEKKIILMEFFID